MVKPKATAFKLVGFSLSRKFRVAVMFWPLVPMTVKVNGLAFVGPFWIRVP